jgi:hypothetical protein
MVAFPVMAYFGKRGGRNVDEEIKYNTAAIYRIQLLEGLGPEMAGWFGGFSVTQGAEGGSLLTGMVTDQAMLLGLIRKVGDLGLTLVSIQRLESQR